MREAEKIACAAVAAMGFGIVWIITIGLFAHAMGWI